ncbi:MAG: OmpA family protein [Saprospiraceae bacterium]
MKNLFFFLVLFLSLMPNIKGQEALPSNPKPGMCYIRCVLEDSWREKEIQITKRPGYTQLEVVPAEYKTTTEQVMIKPATKKLEIIPAVYKKVADTIVIEEEQSKITIVPVKFTNVIEEVINQPAFARFESHSAIEGCKSKDPMDCEVLCYVQHPEQKTSLNIQKIGAESSYVKNKKPGRTTLITKDVIVSPEQVKEIEIPAVYKTITKKVLIKDETVREIKVEPQYENQMTRTLEKQGGVTVWEEIACNLTDLNVLPIFYDLNSAKLTAESRDIINKKLLKLMVEKPNIKIEISSNTDSRDSDDYNLELSQRRAQSVVDYLVSKGIKSSRLIAKGYGESRLKEPCPNGVECTEAQHAKNRRTEFRVLTN